MSYLEKILSFYDYWIPFLLEINKVLEKIPMPNATLSVPLQFVLILLLFWILVRLIRFRGLGKEEPIEAGATVEEDDLDDDEGIEFAVETGDYVEFDDAATGDLDEGEDASFVPEEGKIEASKVDPDFYKTPEGEMAPGRKDEKEAWEIDTSEVDDVSSPSFESAQSIVSEAVDEGLAAEDIKGMEEALEVAKELVKEPKVSWLSRLKNGLKKTKDGFVGKIESVLSGRTTINDDLYEELEEVLVTSDIGIQTAYKLLEKTRQRVEEEKIEDPKSILAIVKSEIISMLDIDAAPIDIDSKKPFVVMVVGVNGTGKTTTIGKIASSYKKDGKKVLLAAADTFRAAAIEQLEVWSQRVGCDIIKQKQGSDPSAVAFDAIDAGMARGSDVVIIDTAGRLHTKSNLMNELGKVKRVIQKKMDDAPHETLLVLDATTGQNAITQAKEFNKATTLSGIILTKLDGTAKGGCIVGIAHEFKLPIRYIGIGEKIDDLRPFVVDDFVKALFGEG